MQLGDVRNLLGTDCDMDYLRSRAKTLKVDALLEEILSATNLLTTASMSPLLPPTSTQSPEHQHTDAHHCNR